MDFYLPTRMIAGRNAVVDNAARLAAFGKRCFLVTSGTAAKRCGALEDVQHALGSQGITYTVYDAIKANPSIASCIEGGHLAHAFHADFILGIGGGSPLDAAKVIAVSAANPELDEKQLYSMSWPQKPLPVVLVGTTAGTGSEVTPVAVITNSDGLKKSFRGDDMYAALSLGDARYTQSMPLSVTASTGIDALCHCLESYFSKKANDISRAFSLQGIAQLFPPLRQIAEGKLPTMDEREILYNGSILGGMAISVTGTVMPHNMGYYLTEQYGVPHGFACASFLPTLLRHAVSCVPEACEALYKRTGTDADSLIALFQAITPDFGIRLSEAEIEAILPRWENNASIQKTVGEISTGQIRQILSDLFLK